MKFSHPDVEYDEKVHCRNDYDDAYDADDNDNHTHMYDTEMSESKSIESEETKKYVNDIEFEYRSEDEKYVNDHESEYSSEDEIAAVLPVNDLGLLDTNDTRPRRRRICNMTDCGENVNEFGIAFICEECDEPCCEDFFLLNCSHMPFFVVCQRFVCPKYTHFNTCHFCGTFVYNKFIDTVIMSGWADVGCGCHIDSETESNGSSPNEDIMQSGDQSDI